MFLNGAGLILMSKNETKIVKLLASALCSVELWRLSLQSVTAVTAVFDVFVLIFNHSNTSKQRHGEMFLC